MNHPEDEKAGREAAAKWRHGIIPSFPATEDYVADKGFRAGFLAGCAHVRTSAEWNIMEKVINQARGVTWVCECRCDSAYTGRGRHEPNARCGEMDDLKAALSELDRIRED